MRPQPTTRTSFFGATIDERLTGQIWITTVATGLGTPRRRTLATAGSFLGGSSRSDELAPPSFLTD